MKWRMVVISVLAVFCLLMFGCITANAETSGVYHGVDWVLDDDGVLTLGNGETQTMTDSGGTKWEASNVTSVLCNGTIVCNASMAEFFKSHTALVSANLSGLDTSNVTNMSSMFQDCEGLTFVDVSAFDVSKVKNISGMFRGCKNIEALDVSKWDTSSVTNMEFMFFDCNSLTFLNVSAWDTSNVTVMTNMFANCRNLAILDVSNWNTSKVTSMCGSYNQGLKRSGLFDNCSSLTSLDVSHWDTSNVKKMELMFSGCSNLAFLDVSHFDTGNVTDISFMFDDCSGLTSLDVSNFDMSKVVDACYMFSGCSNLTSLDVSKWDTSSLRDTYYMFNGCNNLASLDVSHWDTSVMARAECMFCGCWSLASLDVANWDTSNLTDMSNMFSGCRGLTSLDVSGWNTSKVTDMAYVFGSCTGITSLDVANWDTSSVYHASGIFYACQSLTELNVANWNLGQAVYMYQMFYDCTGLTSLNAAQWNTSRAESMWGMFYNCRSLTSLNLSEWDVSHVDAMSNSQGYGMFRNCSNLVSLDISGWDTRSLRTKAHMFDGCDKLSEITLGNKYRTGYTSHMITLPTPPSSQDGIQYTGKWIREDRVYGPFTPEQFKSNYNNETMSGKWVWEPKPTDYTLRFSSASYPNAVGEMAQVTTSATNDYQLVANQYGLFGFVFDHWDDGNGNTYADQAIIPANTYNVGDIVTLNLVMKRRDMSVQMQDGAFTFSIYGNEKALFQPIPASTSYQVYEQTPFGWNLIKQVGNAGTILPDVESEALFLNQYDPLKATVRFAGTKLMDESVAESGSYSFLLYEDDTLIDITSVSDGGLIAFQPITYDQAGVHNYTIREVIGSDNTVEYDTHVEAIKVTVESDGVGHLSVDIQMNNDVIVFNNKSKPGMLILRKAGVNSTDESREGIFYYEVQFVTQNGQPYELAESELNYEEREGEVSEYPDLQPLPEKQKYTLTVTQKYHNKSGKITSDVTTEELSQSELFSIDWVGKPVANVSITEGEDFIVRSGTGWKGIMPAQDLNVTVNYSNNYAVISRDAIRRGWNTADLSPMYAVYFIHKNGTINPSSGNHSFNIDDGTTECVVQAARGGSFDIYQYDLYWYTNADTIYLPEDCSNMFSNLGISSNVEDAGKFDFLNYVDSSRVTNMQGMFRAYGWKTLDLSNLDTSNVTDMSYMFTTSTYRDSVALEELDLSTFVTSNVTDMSHMFENCRRLADLNLSNWDTSSVTDMSYMFNGCHYLRTLDLSGFDTSHVTNMTDMYNLALYVGDDIKLREVILGEYNPFVGDGTSAVLPSPKSGRVYEDGSYVEYTGKWIHESGNYGPYTSEELKDHYTEAMAGKWVWQKAPARATIDKSKWSSNVNGDNSSIRNPLRSATTFSRSRSYDVVEDLPAEAVRIDDDQTACSIYFWKDGTDAYWWSDAEIICLPANVSHMFYNCTRLTSLDVSGFDTSNVTSMQSMFSGCSSLTSLDVSGFDTSNVTTMAYMFYNCSGLTSLDVSVFNTSKVTDMHGMFYSCSSLSSLDLSGFDTSNVTSIENLFYNCSGLTSLDLSNFNTSNVTTMSDLFDKCSSLTSLNLSGFNTSNVTSMHEMFHGCSSLASLDLSMFDTSNVTNMYGMFMGCTGLRDIYVGDLWSILGVVEDFGMFRGCRQLIGGAGTPFNASYERKTYARVDNPPSEPGYLTYKAAP